MSEQFDVVVIGGAFSGAAAALLLLRERPELRIAIVERSRAFDRKVGEATTEVSGHFLTRRLSLTSHLNHHHIAKQGLRFWFAPPGAKNLGDCGELGANYQVRLPSYQVDREVLDQHVLDLAVAAGARLFRPARVLDAEPGRTVTIEHDGERRDLTAHQIIDASGRAAFLARKLNLIEKLDAHPTSSIWARLRGVADLDGHEIRTRYPSMRGTCRTSRSAATNHLTGYGWWCWIIPLKGGDTSVGLVYDERLYTPPQGANLAERLMAHLRAHAAGADLFADATPVEGDVKAYSHLPYFSRQLCGPGWHLAGDATGFLDPLYSAGLDYCSWTVNAAVRANLAELDGAPINHADVNARFARSYRAWFEALYLDKYHYLGDAELMRPAFLLDLALFFFGPVRELYDGTAEPGTRFPFDGPVDGAVAKFMAFYNRRLAALGKKRHAAGVFGRANSRRTLVPSFEPSPAVLKIALQGIAGWLSAEAKSQGLKPATSHAPADVSAAVPRYT